jgi:hypothetical protein
MGEAQDVEPEKSHILRVGGLGYLTDFQIVIRTLKGKFFPLFCLDSD